MRIEACSALTPDLSRSRPADALVNNWIGGSSAAFDVTVTSGLESLSQYTLLPSIRSSVAQPAGGRKQCSVSGCLDLVAYHVAPPYG